MCLITDFEIASNCKKESPTNVNYFELYIVGNVKRSSLHLTQQHHLRCCSIKKALLVIREVSFRLNQMSPLGKGLYRRQIITQRGSILGR